MNTNVKTNYRLSVLAVMMTGLAAGSGVAQAAGYAHASDGSVVISDFGECVRTGFWDDSMNTPECDAALAARLEQERLEAERLAAAEAAARAAAAIKPAAARLITVSDSGDVAFAFDSAKLTDAAISELDRVANALGDYTKVESISISGFTDSTGPESYNKGLSERRAQEVKKVLEAKGVPVQNATVVGYGESQPVADNATRDGRAQNRRVEIRIAGKRAQ